MQLGGLTSLYCDSYQLLVQKLSINVHIMSTKARNISFHIAKWHFKKIHSRVMTLWHFSRLIDVKERCGLWLLGWLAFLSWSLVLSILQDPAIRWRAYETRVIFGFSALSYVTKCIVYYEDQKSVLIFSVLHSSAQPVDQRTVLAALGWRQLCRCCSAASVLWLSLISGISFLWVNGALATTI